MSNVDAANVSIPSFTIRNRLGHVSYTDTFNPSDLVKVCDLLQRDLLLFFDGMTQSPLHPLKQEVERRRILDTNSSSGVRLNFKTTPPLQRPV